MRRVLQVRGKFELELLDIEGVVGVSHSGNDRERLIVYVENPEHREAMPRILAGVPVEVRVVGKVVALSSPLATTVLGDVVSDLIGAGIRSIERFLSPSRTSRVRPAPGGVSCGHPMITAGTLGVVTRDMRVLSNNHVIAAMNEGRPGDPIVQPGRYDGGTPEDAIARLEEFAELVPYDRGYNLVDAAVARPLEPAEAYVTRDIIGIGEVSGWTDPFVGMQVCKSGRTTGVTGSTVIDVNATIKVEGYAFGTAVFANQIVFDNPNMSSIAPGDSGSLLVTFSGNVPLAVGLCFAGSRVVGVANRISYVIREFGVDLGPYVPVSVPPAREMALQAAGAVFPPVFALGTLTYSEMTKYGG